jgi:hypothetical protein
MHVLPFTLPRLVQVCATSTKQWSPAGPGKYTRNQMYFASSVLASMNLQGELVAVVGGLTKVV